ncbi:hypothetical protein OUM_1324 [Helicobacter pylori R038b]|uniref:Uncharacterized protein n=1 Tax=Helicobacter pylori R038b TaxID=1145115 RepID=K2K1L1_HELPX|nr:hypothetical protein OUM_1324 [Helicobacter pylori R038b]
MFAYSYQIRVKTTQPLKTSFKLKNLKSVRVLNEALAGGI